MRRSIVSAAIGAGLAVLAVPASATPTITNDANCAVTTTNPNAIACSGAWTTNLLNNSSAALTAQQTALAAIGYNFNTSTFNSLTGQSSLTGGMLSFGQTLYGITYIGVHFGDGGTGQGDRTIFYEYNFGSSGNTGITLNTQSFSNAVLYATALSPVPEAATWAMMLLGFGAIGLSMQVRRTKAVA